MPLKVHIPLRTDNQGTLHRKENINFTSKLALISTYMSY